jgi:single-stranded-DNA-specific exonuclease
VPNLSRSDRPNLPHQRWHIQTTDADQVSGLCQALGCSPLLAQALINRGWGTLTQVQRFLQPEQQVLPEPREAFEDLVESLLLLETAIRKGQRIAICGDYDADGMTSTALLLRALRALGAQVDYAIPSRMQEGYGLNRRIVEEFQAEGVRLVLTVDNGIAAHEPIARARELGLAVIVTDHHDLPPELPLANAILNPKLLPEASPYRCLAGVGVAYLLATSLVEQLDAGHDLLPSLLDLFTLGTIADLAPLTGVNRCWVKRGLRHLPQSSLAGVQALIEVAQVGGRGHSLKPEDIGFRLGPRINAVGRIGDPQLVIDLLTTDHPSDAQRLALACEQCNLERRSLCERIEQEAVAWVDAQSFDFAANPVLVVVQPDWHHGVIGIVASRLVERYGVPVFIGTPEEAGTVRGSARSIPEFNVFDALEHCHDLLLRYGGHRAAGGFSLAADQLDNFTEQLQVFGRACLAPEDLKPLVRIDGEASLQTVDLDLLAELQQLQPFGIDNDEPVYWSRDVAITDQRLTQGGHLQLSLQQGDHPPIAGIAWRWSDFFPLPTTLDVAYRLKENRWNGRVTLQLEIQGVRISRQTGSAAQPDRDFRYAERDYCCRFDTVGQTLHLVITNAQGDRLRLQRGALTAQLSRRNRVETIDVRQPFFRELILMARQTLETFDPDPPA